MEDFSDYDGSKENDSATGDSWNDIDRVLEELEQSKERQQKILEDMIEDIESELERIHNVYDENISALKDSITSQKDRLEIAKSGAGLNEETVRSRLAQLYKEKRQERREELENRLELLMRKWELKRELEELSQDMDLSA